MSHDKWGYLRETSENAIKAGKEADAGLHRAGLEEYIKVVFPTVRDWVHDKATGKSLDGKKLKTRPDYRSEKLKLIVEFDGVQHYTNPDKIRRDDRRPTAPPAHITNFHHPLVRTSRRVCGRIVFSHARHSHPAPRVPTCEQLFGVKGE